MIRRARLFREKLSLASLAIGIAFALALVGARAVRYAVPAVPAPLDALLDRALQLGQRCLLLDFLISNTFIRIVTLFPRWAPLAALALLFARPRLAFEKSSGTWVPLPWLRICAAGGLAIGNIALDISPWIAWMCGSSLILIFAADLASLAGLRPPSKSFSSLACAFVSGAWLLRAKDPSDAVAAVTWALAAAGLARLRTQDASFLDRVALSLLCIAAAQALGSWFPLIAPTHRGRLLASGYSEGFCEDARRHRLFAALPFCDIDLGFEACHEGRIDEFDSRDLSLVRTQSPFSWHFYGRLMRLVCLDKSIVAGMGRTDIQGRHNSENIMELGLDDLKPQRDSLFGDEPGQCLAYDRKRDALLVSSEWSDRILRLDRSSGALDRDVARSIPARPPEKLLFFRRLRGSFYLGNSTIHRGRDSVFVAEWMTGSRVYELSLSTFGVRSYFAPANGGNTFAVIDEKLGRLYTTGLWGLDAFDLETGKLLARVRLGFGVREPAIDDVHDLVFVATTVEGKIWVLDRKSLAVLGSLSLGMGARNAYVTLDRTHLIGSSKKATYSWRTDELDRLFRRRLTSSRRFSEHPQPRPADRGKGD